MRGDWERGLALAERAKQLNPHHPGWYWFADFYNAYRQGDYRGALGFALKVNLPGHWATHAALAAAYGQLGEREAARARPCGICSKLRPDFAADRRGNLEKWWDARVRRAPDRRLAQGGAGDCGGPSHRSRHPVVCPFPLSGAARADEGFWVAVLPFKYSGANADLDGAGRGPDRRDRHRAVALLLPPRHRAQLDARYAGEAADVRAVGKELGARYVMEGSLRQAGASCASPCSSSTRLRAPTSGRRPTSGPSSPDAVFELQDDLVPRIVSTVADHSASCRGP